MTDVVVEPQAVIASPDSTFPQEIKVTFTLKLIVNDQADRDYWLEPGTSTTALDAVADFTDVINDNYSAELVSMNGLTYAQIQQAMSDGAI
jgi:hypothetical protein